MKRKLIFIVTTALLYSNFGVQEEKTEEYMAKFIVSLVRYIEWPGAMQKGNFKIGVYGIILGSQVINFAKRVVD